MIVFRVDASVLIGSGHVMRCLTLAEELSQGGAEVGFISRNHEGSLNDLICNKGFKLYELPAAASQVMSNNSTRGEYAAWLGTSQEDDASDTIEILKEIQPDWLIVDHYAIDEAWERFVRPYVKKTMVIDDLADRKHECDLLLNQNYVKGEHQRYADLIPPSCTTLLGPQYALLRKEFTKARENLKPRDGSVNRVFVFFGGVDPDNMTGKALEALSAPEFSQIYADVVIGAANPYRAAISNAVKQRPQTTLHVQVGTIAELMAKADLALCAGGTTTWERFCLGLPSLVVTIADNQVPFTRDLHQDGLLRWLGTSQEVNTHTLRKRVMQALQDNDRNLQEAKKGMKFVDGNGAKKVAEIIKMQLKTHTMLRSITSENYETHTGRATLSLTVLSDRTSWLNPWIERLVAEWEGQNHHVTWVHQPADVPDGELCFMLSCSQLVKPDILKRNKHNLVVHESDLPQGKGWSPMTWQVLEGKQEIPVTLFEAEEAVDSGPIYLQDAMILEGHELVDELRAQQADATFNLCRDFMDRYPEILQQAVSQSGEESFYQRRRPDDSRLDPHKTIAEQFNLLRVVDNERYPAFFDWLGQRYTIKIEKAEHQ